MKTKINHEKYGEILYNESAWTGKKELSINGKPVKKEDKNTFATEGGEKIAITGNYFLGVKAHINNEKIVLVPSIKWYEIILAILPLILVIVWGNSVQLCKILPVVGGAIGGAISGAMAVTSLIVMKCVRNVWLKLVIGLAFLAATFGICVGVGYAVVASLT